MLKLASGIYFAVWQQLNLTFTPMPSVNKMLHTLPMAGDLCIFFKYDLKKLVL